MKKAENISGWRTSEKFTLAVFTIWTFVHTYFLVIAEPTKRGKVKMWPFDGLTSNLKTDYDFQEFTFYVIFPLSIMILYFIFYKRSGLNNSSISKAT